MEGEVAVTNDALTRLLVKVAGAVILAYTVASGPDHMLRAFGVADVDAPFWIRVLYSFIPMLLPLLVGLWLFALPGMVTRAIVSDSRADADVPLPIRAIEAAALFVLGIYLIAQSLADGAYLYAKLNLYYRIVETHAWANVPPVPPEEFAQIVAAAMQFVLALFLILGSRGIVDFKNRILALRGP
jgi:hypothetical protein